MTSVPESVEGRADMFAQLQTVAANHDPKSMVGGAAAWAVDKIEGLETDLQLAVEVAFSRGATEWTRLNYPKEYARLTALAQGPKEEGGQTAVAAGPGSGREDAPSSGTSASGWFPIDTVPTRRKVVVTWWEDDNEDYDDIELAIFDEDREGYWGLSTSNHRTRDRSQPHQWPAYWREPPPFPIHDGAARVHTEAATDVLRLNQNPSPPAPTSWPTRESVAAIVREARNNTIDTPDAVDRLLALFPAQPPATCNDGLQVQPPSLTFSDEQVRTALNYVADNTYCGRDAEWHFKPGYDPQVVLDALAALAQPKEGEGGQAVNAGLDRSGAGDAPSSGGFQVHVLKTWPGPFAAVRSGAKTWEYRKDDGPSRSRGA